MGVPENRFTSLLVPVLCVLTFLFSHEVSGQNNHQRSYPRQSREYAALRLLHLEQGVAMPFNSGPFSEAELRHALDRISPAQLSTAGRDQYDWLVEQFRHHQERGYQEEERRFRFAAQALFSLETYLHTDQDNPFMEYAWEDRLPFAQFPLEGWVLNGGYGIFDLDFRKNIPDFQRYPTYGRNGRQYRRDDDGVFEYGTEEEDPWTNLPVIPSTLDTQFPHRAFVSFGGDRWNLQLGRDILDWGNAHTGNLYISDYADWHDFLRLTTFWERFKFTFAWVSLDPYLIDDEVEFRRIPATGDQTGTEGDPVLVPPAPHKNLITQRWEVRLWDRLGLSYTEGIFLGGEAPDLRHINPVYHFHNLYTNIQKVGNAHRSFEFDVLIRPGLMVYAGITPGQYTSPTLEPNTDITSEPNAFATIAGVEWLRPLESRGVGHLHGVFEAVYVSPWMYIHNATLTSMTTRRFVLAHHGDGRHTYYDKPIGHPGGNDHVVLHADVTYGRAGMFRYGLSGTLRGDGERRINDLLEPRIDEFRTDDVHPERRSSGPQTEKEARAIAPSGEFPQWTAVATIHGEIEPWFFPGFNTRESRRTLRAGSSLSFQWMKNRFNRESDWEFDLQYVLSATIGI